jgi:hypothetical protein
VSPDHYRKVGIGTFRSRSLALRHGSCLLPLKLSFSSQPDDAVFDASRHSDLIAPSVVIAFPGAFQTDRSIRDNPSPFQNPAATPDLSDGFLFVQNRRAVDHHTGSQ